MQRGLKRGLKIAKIISEVNRERGSRAKRGSPRACASTARSAVDARYMTRANRAKRGLRAKILRENPAPNLVKGALRETQTDSPPMARGVTLTFRRSKIFDNFRKIFPNLHWKA